MLACEQALWGVLAVGREMEGELLLPPARRPLIDPQWNQFECGSLQPDIVHSCCGQLTTVKTGYLLTSNHMTILQAQVSIEIRCFFFKFTADNHLVFNWSQAQLFLDFFIAMFFN